MLIAEEFVLMALDRDGTVARSQSAAAVGVTGALVAELVHDGHLTLDDRRIHLTGTKAQHRLLIETLDGFKPHEGKMLKNTLGSIKHRGWSEVVDFMIDAGVLSRGKQVFWATRHPILDPRSQGLLLGEVHSAAFGDGPLDRRMATLPGVGWRLPDARGGGAIAWRSKKAKQRVRKATEQVPVAAAVKYAIDAMAVVVVG